MIPCTDREGVAVAVVARSPYRRAPFGGRVSKAIAARTDVDPKVTCTPFVSSTAVAETREDGAEEARRTLWRAASPTIRAMRQHGLLGHAATVETLEMLELLPPTGTGTEGMPVET